MSRVRISDNRYARDRVRYDVAYNMLQLGARAKSISAWTRLSGYQIRTLAEEYPEPLVRHRGRLPNQLHWFWRGGRRDETALLASFFQLFHVIPTETPKRTESVQSLARGAQLCHAYSTYLTSVDGPRISFEYALLLFWSLARKDGVAIGRCPRCLAVNLVDLLATGNRVCEFCEAAPGRQTNRDSDLLPKICSESRRQLGKRKSPGHNKEMRRQRTLF